MLVAPADHLALDMRAQPTREKQLSHKGFWVVVVVVVLDMVYPAACQQQAAQEFHHRQRRMEDWQQEAVLDLARLIL